jgi:mannose-1-phosphate guanylyltransferase/mannose-6-phosphate isomerase
MSQKLHILPAVMIGGAGTRLWPLSRRSRPKQFLPLLGGRTMLQATVERVSGGEGSVVFDAPVLIAGAEHEDLVRSQLDPEAIGELVLEPVGRNTAPCAVVAAELAARRNRAQLILLLPADHHVADVPAFRRAIAAAAPVAAEGALVTFGVRPTSPATGYGYIRAAGEGLSRVEAFVEKPDLRTAERYLSEGGYFWNAGIFLMRADVLLTEMERHRPDVLEAARSALGNAGEGTGRILLDATAFHACPSDSIDYAVMERTDAAAVMPLDVGWSDIGDFDALWAASDKDDAANAPAGPVRLSGASGNLIVSDGPLVAAVGVKNLAVIVHDGVVLVIDRAHAQEVKTVRDLLARGGPTDLL